jgi:hypothetical protein
MSGLRSIVVVGVSLCALILPSIASAESQEVEPPGLTQTAGNGVVTFNRAFAAPVSCTLLALADGTHSYTFTGFLSEEVDRAAVKHVSVHLNINTGDADDYFDGYTRMADTSIVNSVPEPSTLVLFSSGALSLFGMMRRRMSL